jgi:hypothetical protein
VGVGVGGAETGGVTSAVGAVCLAGPLRGVRGGVGVGVAGFELEFVVTLGGVVTVRGMRDGATTGDLGGVRLVC